MPLIPALGGQRQRMRAEVAWSVERVPGQPALLHRETLSRKKTTKQTKTKKEQEKKNYPEFYQSPTVRMSSQFLFVLVMLT